MVLSIPCDSIYMVVFVYLFSRYFILTMLAAIELKRRYLNDLLRYVLIAKF
jgi:hypothetical protein